MSTTKKQLQELIKLNSLEAITLASNYFFCYLNSLFRDFSNPEQRNILKTKLKEYLAITKEENNYYKLLIANLTNIKNTLELDEILYSLDILNEQTYLYYDRILLEYEDNMQYHTSNKIIPAKDFKTLIERKDYQEKILGLILETSDLDSYFNIDDAYHYLKQNTKYLETSNNSSLFYGCYLQEKDNILTGIKLLVPPITNLETMLQNVYFYKLGCLYYPYLNEKIPSTSFTLVAHYEEELFKQKVLNK